MPEIEYVKGDKDKHEGNWIIFCLCLAFAVIGFCVGVWTAGNEEGIDTSTPKDSYPEFFPVSDVGFLPVPSEERETRKWIRPDTVTLAVERGTQECSELEGYLKTDGLARKVLDCYERPTNAKVLSYMKEHLRLLNIEKVQMQKQEMLDPARSGINGKEASDILARGDLWYETQVENLALSLGLAKKEISHASEKEPDPDAPSPDPIASGSERRRR